MNKKWKIIFLFIIEKNLSSDRIQGKMCQPIVKSRIQADYILMFSGVFSAPHLSSDVIVANGGQKPIDNQGLASSVEG